MSNLSNEQLENLLTLADAATPGPWTAWEGNTSVHYGTAEKNTRGEYMPNGHDLLEICQTDNGREECEDIEPGDPVDDAAYIAAAHPGTVRLLIQELLQHRAAAHATGEAVELSETAFADALNLASKCPASWRISLYEKIGIMMKVRGETFDGTTAPAQTPPPAAPRCGGGGVVGAWVPVGEDGRGPGGKMTTHPDGSMSIEYPMLAIICQDMDGAPFEYGPLYGFYNPSNDDWLRADGETIIWGVTHYYILPAIPPLPTCATCPAAARDAAEAGEAEEGGVKA